jgi:hypothetical protein
MLRSRLDASAARSPFWSRGLRQVASCSDFLSAASCRRLGHRAPVLRRHRAAAASELLAILLRTLAVSRPSIDEFSTAFSERFFSFRKNAPEKKMLLFR